MPEGPEVERVRRSLEPWLVGARVVAVTLRRRDIVVGPGDPPGGVSRQRATARSTRSRRPRPIRPAELLLDDTIAGVERHGKQLAIVGTGGRALVIHLGMTGRLLVDARGTVNDAASHPHTATASATIPHTHIVWRLDTPVGPVRLRFIDPRRFGGVWVVPDRAALESRRSALGPDATRVTGDELRRACSNSARPIKAALLDQRVVAGVGNIYADEALFQARLVPSAPCETLTPGQFDTLAHTIRHTIAGAIEAGGSTIRDYADANGTRGNAQLLHQVYGRGGQPCACCGNALACATVAQRTTVWCPICQR